MLWYTLFIGMDRLKLLKFCHKFLYIQIVFFILFLGLLPLLCKLYVLQISGVRLPHYNCVFHSGKKWVLLMWWWVHAGFTVILLVTAGPSDLGTIVVPKHWLAIIILSYCLIPVKMKHVHTHVSVHSESGF